MELWTCHVTWADEIGHNADTNEHRCNEVLGFHARKLSRAGGYVVHICTCKAEMWDDV